MVAHHLVEGGRVADLDEVMVTLVIRTISKWSEKNVRCNGNSGDSNYFEINKFEN